jgi:hypothetical protein
MNRPRDQFLSGALFALDENVGASGGDELHLAKYALERCALPDDAVDLHHPFRLT